MAFEVDQIYLSMTEHEQWSGRDTGVYHTANVYTVEGVLDEYGNPRLLSIGQLVMALCLQRAYLLEYGDVDPVTKKKRELGIIDYMQQIEDNSEQLEKMTNIENEILAGDVNMSSKTLVYKGETYTYYRFLADEIGVDDVPTGIVNKDSTALISAMESKMDEMNSLSQKTMIELQSKTNKRDQTYDMISNVLKSINTILTATSNNM